MEAIPFIIAAAVSAGGAVYSSRQQSAAQKTESRIAKRNAEINRQNAFQATEEANAELERRRRAYSRFRATQINSAVSGGLDPSSITDILTDSALEKKMDDAALLYKGRKEAAAHEQQAVGNLFQSSLLRSQASATKTGGYLSAAGELAGGLGSYYQTYPIKKKPAGS